MDMDVREDHRAYLQVEISNLSFVGLLDSGATHTCLNASAWSRLEAIGYKLTPSRHAKITVACGATAGISGVAHLPVSMGGVVKIIPMLVVPSLSGELILGMEFWRFFELKPDMKTGVCTFPQINMMVVPKDSLSEDQRIRLSELILKFRPKLMDRGLGCTTRIRHHIETGDAQPVKRRYFQFSPKLLEILYAELDKMLADGIVQPSKSAWSSPVMLVPKKDKSYRVVLDFRGLNEVTLKYAYPQPRVQAILDSLRDARFISSLDIKSAFYQIFLTAESRAKTAFVVPGRGLFEFLRMPQGLCNSPATWQRLIDSILGDLQGVFVYMGDIILVTSEFEAHLKLLETVLERLSEAGLTVNLDKCNFCRPELTYLGYVVNSEGLKVDPNKVAAVVNYPRPTCASDVRRFYGLAGWYRRFIKDFSEVCAPLTLLTKKNAVWRWGKEQEDAFRTLKERLVNAPVLRCPDFGKMFTLHCDASNNACGCILSKETDDGSGSHVIAFASRMFTAIEKKYSVTERECLAVLWAIEHFRGYLEGYHFEVITDHHSWLNRLKDPFGRLARWALRLQQFDFTIKHRKGEEHEGPDALSRAFPEPTAVVSSVGVEFAATDPWYRRMVDSVRHHPDDFTNWKLDGEQLYKLVSVGSKLPLQWNKVIPAELRESVFREMHDDPTAGHMGTTRTINRIRGLYYWPGMRRDTKKYVDCCDVCIRSKSTNLKPPGLMGMAKTVTEPFEVVSCDLMGPLTRSNKGNKYLVVATCYFSKFVVMRPLRSDTTQNVVNFLKNDVFLAYGVPRLLLCDNGPCFKSKLFQSFLKSYGVDPLKNFFYHAQSNPTERVNRVIGTMMRSYVVNTHKKWDENLVELQYALRSYTHESTGFTAHRLVFGREVPLDGKLRPIALDPSGSVPLCGPRGSSELAERLGELWRETAARLKKAYETQSRSYNLRRRPVDVAVGAMVYRRNFEKSDAAEGVCVKLLPKYIGPFTVKARMGSLGYLLEDSDGRQDGPWHVQDLKIVPTYP